MFGAEILNHFRDSGGVKVPVPGEDHRKAEPVNETLLYATGVFCQSLEEKVFIVAVLLLTTAS